MTTPEDRFSTQLEISPTPDIKPSSIEANTPTAMFQAVLKWLGDTVHYNLFEQPWEN